MPDSHKLTGQRHTRRPTKRARKQQDSVAKHPTVPSSAGPTQTSPAPLTPADASPLDVPAQRKAPRLIKITYNKQRIRVMMAILGLSGIFAIALVAWTQREAIGRRIHPQQSINKPYQLSAPMEQIDKQKLNEAREKTNPLQSSQSATPIERPESEGVSNSTGGAIRVPTDEELDTYTLEQLHNLLAQQIAELKAEKQDVRPIEVLKQRNTRQELRKAIQLAREYQTLYLYYQ